MTLISSAGIKRSSEPHQLDLPLEIWSIVLTNVKDPYGLWMNCRGVSKTFKAESERVFYKEFLPSMFMTWNMYRERIPWIHLTAFSDKEKSSGQGSMAYFRLHYLLSAWNIPNTTAAEQPQRVDIALDRVLDALSYRDRRSAKQNHTHMAGIQDHHDGIAYLNDTVPADIELHLKFSLRGAMYQLLDTSRLGYISFDWIRYATRFFQEERHIRNVVPDHEILKTQLWKYPAGAERVVANHLLSRVQNLQLAGLSEREQLIEFIRFLLQAGLEALGEPILAGTMELFSDCESSEVVKARNEFYERRIRYDSALEEGAVWASDTLLAVRHDTIVNQLLRITSRRMVGRRQNGSKAQGRRLITRWIHKDQVGGDAEGRS